MPMLVGTSLFTGFDSRLTIHRHWRGVPCRKVCRVYWKSTTVMGYHKYNTVHHCRESPSPARGLERQVYGPNRTPAVDETSSKSRQPAGKYTDFLTTGPIPTSVHRHWYGARRKGMPGMWEPVAITGNPQPPWRHPLE